MVEGRPSLEALLYLGKAEESLAAAAADVDGGRYNAAAARAYFACFQAAVAALMAEGVRPGGRREDWTHQFVRARFDGVLVNARKVYPAGQRGVLDQTAQLRAQADYSPDNVGQRRARLGGEGGWIAGAGSEGASGMRVSLEEMAKKDPRVDDLVEQVCERIRSSYPEARFAVSPNHKYHAGYVTAYVHVYTNAEDGLDVVDPLLMWLSDILIAEEIDIQVLPRPLSSWWDQEGVA